MKPIAHGTQDTARAYDLHQATGAEGVSTAEAARLVVKLRPIVFRTNAAL